MKETSDEDYRAPGAKHSSVKKGSKKSTVETKLKDAMGKTRRASNKAASSKRYQHIKRCTTIEPMDEVLPPHRRNRPIIETLSEDEEKIQDEQNGLKEYLAGARAGS
jgi:hypothetical protein